MTKQKQTEVKQEDFTSLFSDVKKIEPKHVLVISLDENNVIHFNTNSPNYPFLHYLLNRSVLEINLHERSTLTNIPEKE